MTGTTFYSVLMVDDNAAMREALARSLTRRGCRVTTAVSAVEGLQALKERSFDVVITDLNMPERSGLWFWRQAIVSRAALRGRFILIASEPLPDPASLALFMQTERFVLKPLSLDTLWHQVEEILAGVPRAPSAPPADPPGRAARGAP
jgi:DNA-binding NtrC family response regulator